MKQITFDKIEVGSRWNREELAELWGYNGRQGLAKGVVTPKDLNKIILFVTREKLLHSEQFKDVLEGDTLHWDGQPKHRTDDRLIYAADHGDEIHLFYRDGYYNQDRSSQQFAYLVK